MKYTVILLILGLFLAVTAQPEGKAQAYNCNHAKEFERTFAAQALSELAIAAGAGSLMITGDAKVERIQVKASACASSKKILEKLDVVFEQDSDLRTVKTQIPRDDSWGSNYSASIDLEVILPATLVLDVKDSSGDAEVSNIAAVKMVDSSGDLKIANVAGNVDVTDSSGALRIIKVAGDVKLIDSSGGIDASDIQGSFTVMADSSGDIEVTRVGKDVLIKIDSSGSISVDDVKGDFVVGKDTSGGIEYDNVAGDVKLPRKRG